MEQSVMRAWVEVDLGALQRNAAALAASAGKPLLPMVKADAYGLGAVPVVRALEHVHPWGYGVATVPEGVELRQAGIERPVVIFTSLPSDELAGAHAARLTPSLGCVADIERWKALGGEAWHLSVDTGMNRAGARCDDVEALLDAMRNAPPEGAYTHFHSSERNDGTMDEQERRFLRAIAHLPTPPPLLHAENSAAITRRAPSSWNLVRPGVFLYGVGSGDGALLSPEPVVELRASVVEMRMIPDGETVSYDATYRAVGPRVVATLSIGYADGYPRALSNRGVAIVNRHRVPVAGVVTMDMTMVDVTGVPCRVGDVATLLGRDGDHLLDAETVARVAEMSPYELLTNLRGRLQRIYREPAT